MKILSILGELPMSKVHSFRMSIKRINSQLESLEKELNLIESDPVRNDLARIPEITQQMSILLDQLEQLESQIDIELKILSN